MKQVKGERLKAKGFTAGERQRVEENEVGMRNAECGKGI